MRERVKSKSVTVTLDVYECFILKLQFTILATISKVFRADFLSPEYKCTSNIWNSSFCQFHLKLLIRSSSCWRLLYQREGREVIWGSVQVAISRYIWWWEGGVTRLEGVVLGGVYESDFWNFVKVEILYENGLFSRNFEQLRIFSYYFLYNISYNLAWFPYEISYTFK